MRAWKVEQIQGKPIVLEMELNRLQTKGFTILTVLPASFGFNIVAYMDSPDGPNLASGHFSAL